MRAVVVGIGDSLGFRNSWCRRDLVLSPEVFHAVAGSGVLPREPDGRMRPTLDCVDWMRMRTRLHQRRQMDAEPFPSALWPAAPPTAIGPTVDHLHRLAQIAGKYTLDQIYEPNWGNIVLDVTGRGYATPTLRHGGIVFRVEFDLLNGRATIAANTGTASLPLADGTVARFFEDFVTTAGSLGIPAPGSTIEPEIPDAPHFDADTEYRPYDPVVARWVAAALGTASIVFTAWQAPYRGHRPRVGIMWGGFDLSATRYNGRPIVPPASAPMFQRNGMTEEVVAVGFVLGDDTTPANFYAYISPAPTGIATADLGAVARATPKDAGLATLTWEAARTSADPDAEVIEFADAIWRAAVELGGWDAGLTLERHNGWYAATHPMFEPAS